MLMSARKSVELIQFKGRYCNPNCCKAKCGQSFFGEKFIKNSVKWMCVKKPKFL